MSYLPSFLSAAMRWSKVSEKYWKRAFCLCTSSPRMRFRNLLMEQSFSTSRQPDLDSRPPIPTDSSPCFMSQKKAASLQGSPGAAALCSPSGLGWW